ncbi:MAG: CRTAC1 family protein [Phycisphaerales bacterium]|nr:CRTAC1 family protein [Phycisphaerales bacterium]NNM24812.1 CRTAC1 family protein [Phycisphaerales bacterium]
MRGRIAGYGLGVMALIVAASSADAGSFQFHDLGAKRGLTPYAMATGMGAGLAAADFDDDGDVDVFVPTGDGTPDQLYRNRGDGTFEEVAATLGVDATTPHRAALWLDLDPDGRLDLVVVGGDCFSACGPDVPALTVYRQTADGGFVDVTVASGLGLDGITDFNHVAGLAAGDLNGDDAVDLVLTLWFGPASLFLNNGDGTFVDASAGSGIAASDHHWQPIIHDFDGDGWADIFMAVDFFANNLYLNQRDGTFVDVAAAAGLDNTMNDMGVTLGDCDNDGDFDLYITNIYDFVGQGEHNVLFRNDSVGAALSFTNVAIAAGVDEGGWGWGTTFLDADNDGDLDLAATNGFNDHVDPSRFFLNENETPIRFTDASAAAGFDDEEWGSGLIAFDLERDGDLDMMQVCNLGGPVRLLVNDAAETVGGHWLLVRPRMDGRNPRALGAVVRVKVGDVVRTRAITAGTSFLCQEPAEAHFGVGDAAIIDEVRVDWPGGGHDRWFDVPVDQVLTLSPPPATSGDVDGDGDVDFTDLLSVLAAWGPCAGDCPADLDGDGSVGFSDVLTVLAGWTG